MPEAHDQIVFVEYAGEQIPVSLSFNERKKLSISVYPDGRVMAIAPLGKEREEIVARLQRRRSWIAKQRRHFETFQPLPEKKRYLSGETHLYLGRRYRLRVHRSEVAVVKLVGQFLNVYVPTPKAPGTIAAVLDLWYQQHAEPIFRDRVQRAIAAAASLKIDAVSLRIRPMKTRWGSCSKAGRITLNTELIRAPLHCIEYVIMHELCHLRVHDHSPAFYRLLNRHMPEWEKRKQRLELVAL